MWTLTRDRLEYTQAMVAALREKAGVPFRHYVLDNGSEDGTPAWLRENSHLFHHVEMSPTNLGISKGANRLLDCIRRDGGADYVAEIDNDALVLTEGLLAHMIRAFEGLGEFGPTALLSPRVVGIVNQPTRVRDQGSAGLRIGVTGHVGGLAFMAPWRVWELWRFPEHLPKASGQDSSLCAHVVQKGGLVGYVENLEVEHMETTDGQARRFPDYFRRKRREEVEPPA